MDYKLRLATSDRLTWLDDIFRILKTYPVLVLAAIILNMDMFLGRFAVGYSIPMLNGFANLETSYNPIIFGALAYFVHHDILLGRLQFKNINFKRLLLFILLFVFVFYILGLVVSLLSWQFNIWLEGSGFSAKIIANIQEYTGILMMAWLAIMFPLILTSLPEFVVVGKVKIKAAMRRGLLYFWKITFGILAIVCLMFLLGVGSILLVKLLTYAPFFGAILEQSLHDQMAVSKNFFVQIFLSILNCIALILETRLISRIFLMDSVGQQGITRRFGN